MIFILSVSARCDGCCAWQHWEPTLCEVDEVGRWACMLKRVHGRSVHVWHMLRGLVDRRVVFSENEVKSGF